MRDEPASRPPNTLAELLRANLQARTGQVVALRETHISWVLLAGELAYKLKKPVKLPFLDFSTPALRRHFCEEELRMNRRWAPGLYLGIEPVRGSAEAPHFGGRGPVIDHAVRMRRFADDALLSRRLRRGEVSAHDIDAIARQVASMHDPTAVLTPPAALATPSRIRRAISGALEQVEQRFGARAVATIAPWLAEQACALAPVWRRRREQGAVRECHGDLHLDNLACIGGQWCAFDAIEFDPALRWIDVMADVAFLTMDLRAHGHAALAHRLLDTYLECRGDFDGLKVLRCYEVYRALVRALVRDLRPHAAEGADAGAPGAGDYLACARALVRQASRPPRLLITCGVSGSGKSTVAARWVERHGAVRVRSDVERKRLFGLRAFDASAPNGLQIYGASASRRTYGRLARCARSALVAGWPVVVDAAFLRLAQRRPFERLATQLGTPFTILHCHAPEAALRARIRARMQAGGDPSEADVGVLRQQLHDWRPFAADERGWVRRQRAGPPTPVPHRARATGSARLRRPPPRP